MQPNSTSKRYTITFLQTVLALPKPTSKTSWMPADNCAFPALGKKYDSRYRLLIVRNHLVFYRQDTEATTIVAIIDGRRDVAAVLDDLGDTSV